MRSLYIILMVSSFIPLVISGCSLPEAPPDQDRGFTIAATFYPLYELTKGIAGDKAVVYSIISTQIEPHDYEPKPSDLQKLDSADAFVTVGIGFDELEEELIRGANPAVKVIPASSGIVLLQTDESDGGRKGTDPHIWLSPKNAQKMARNIMDGLILLDPSNRESYLGNGKTIIAKLDALDAEFREGLSACKKEVVLVNHNAFAYLARDYGFAIITIHGLEPEAEPTPQQLANLIQKAEEYDLKYIFYEELVDSRTAETIAEEIGAEVLELNPLEGTDDPAATYFSLMRENLNNLKIALECG